MRKFEVQGVIGMGAYGVVLKAVNKQSKELVAIKKFKESDQNPIIRKIALREVKALKNAQHENIVKFKEAFRRDNKLNIVFEFVPKTVLEDIEENPQGLSSNKICSYIFQLLKGLRFLHKNGYIHRDIKPENLLLDQNGLLKLCDFGFARKIQNDGGQNECFLTNYVATRWYRSPELILTNQYNTGVDIWAVGCIMGELLDGQPMFPGDDTIDQIYQIISILGPFGNKLESYFKRNEEFKNIKFPKVNDFQTLEKRYKGQACKKMIDLMKQLLEIDDKKRITAHDALQHPFFEELLKNDYELKNELLLNNKENIIIQQDVKKVVKKPSKKKDTQYKEHFTDNNKDDSKSYLKFQIENHSFYNPITNQKDIFYEKNKKNPKKAKTLQPKKVSYINNN